MRSPACCRATQAIEAIKKSIKKTYGKKGDQIVQQNFAAVDQTLANLFEVKVPGQRHQHDRDAARWSPTSAPDFVKEVTATIMAGFGDTLPVSAMPVDGTYPDRHRRSGKSATSPWKSRCGTFRSASSATSARSSARTRPSG